MRRRRCALPAHSKTLARKAVARVCAKRLGLRREAKRHAAFERTTIVGSSLASGARESAVAAALCRRTPKRSRERRLLACARSVLDCGGKRSATPLSSGRQLLVVRWRWCKRESAVAAALCRRTPKRSRERRLPACARSVLDCGGKRSATPLSSGRQNVGSSLASRAHESAVAAALCRRNPRRWRDC